MGSRKQKHVVQKRRHSLPVKGGASWSDLGGNVYQGTVEYGRFMSWVSLAFGLLIGMILSFCGAYLSLIRKEKYTAYVTAVVKSADCVRIKTEQAANNVNCDLKISYEVGGKQYHRSLYVNSVWQDIATGSTIDIRYDPTNPDDVTQGIRPAIIGWILLLIGVSTLIGSVVFWYAAQHFEVAAAATGASSIVGMFQRN